MMMRPKAVIIEPEKELRLAFKKIVECHNLRFRANCYGSVSDYLSAIKKGKNNAPLMCIEDDSFFEKKRRKGKYYSVKYLLSELETSGVNCSPSKIVLTHPGSDIRMWHELGFSGIVDLPDSEALPFDELILEEKLAEKNLAHLFLHSSERREKTRVKKRLINFAFRLFREIDNLTEKREFTRPINVAVIGAGTLGIGIIADLSKLNLLFDKSLVGSIHFYSGDRITNAKNPRTEMNYIFNVIGKMNSSRVFGHLTLESLFGSCSPDIIAICTGYPVNYHLAKDRQDVINNENYFVRTSRKVDEILHLIRERFPEDNHPLITIESNPDSFLLYAYQQYGFNPNRLFSVNADGLRESKIIIDEVRDDLEKKLERKIHSTDFLMVSTIGRHGSHRQANSIRRVRFFVNPSQPIALDSILKYSNSKWNRLDSKVMKLSREQGFNVVSASQITGIPYHDTPFAFSSAVLHFATYQRIFKFPLQVYVQFNGQEGFLNMRAVSDSAGTISVDPRFKIESFEPHIQEYIREQLASQNDSAEKIKECLGKKYNR